MVNRNGPLKLTQLRQISQHCVVKNRTWVRKRIEDLFGEIKEAKVGVGVDEFGGDSRVLVEAMEDEAGVDLLELLGFGAEV